MASSNPAGSNPNTNPNAPPFVQSGEPLPVFLQNFWQRQVDTAEQESPDFRHPPLPLARIKKVMKSDPDVKMIAADAPILFCKACEIFIAEITARAYIVADANKRRTLSRADIAKALAKSDQFDFLIDIVPREEFASAGAGAGAGGGGGGGGGGGSGGAGGARGGGLGAGAGGVAGALEGIGGMEVDPHAGATSVMTEPGMQSHQRAQSQHQQYQHQQHQPQQPQQIHLEHSNYTPGQSAQYSGQQQQYHPQPMQAMQGMHGGQPQQQQQQHYVNSGYQPLPPGGPLVGDAQPQQQQQQQRM